MLLLVSLFRLLFAYHLDDGREYILTKRHKEIDAMMPPARKSAIEDLLANQVAQPYQVSLYGGTSHGFGTRANISDPEQKFGKEAAFYQAVRWFNVWAGGAL